MIFKTAIGATAPRPDRDAANAAPLSRTAGQPFGPLRAMAGPRSTPPAADETAPAVAVATDPDAADRPLSSEQADIRFRDLAYRKRYLRDRLNEISAERAAVIEELRSVSQTFAKEVAERRGKTKAAPEG